MLPSQPVYALDCTVLPSDICSKAEDSEAIFALLNFFLTILVVLVGIVAIGMFIWAGILYASGDANSNRVAQAKTIMTNTTIGIIAFGLTIRPGAQIRKKTKSVPRRSAALIARKLRDRKSVV